MKSPSKNVIYVSNNNNDNDPVTFPRFRGHTLGQQQDNVFQNAEKECLTKLAGWKLYTLGLHPLARARFIDRQHTKNKAWKYSTHKRNPSKLVRQIFILLYFGGYFLTGSCRLYVFPSSNSTLHWIRFLGAELPHVDLRKRSSSLEMWLEPVRATKGES